MSQPKRLKLIPAVAIKNIQQYKHISQEPHAGTVIISGDA